MILSNRFCTCLLGMFLAATVCAAQEMPPDEEWTPITIGDTSGFIVPDQVLEDMGLPVRHVPEDQNAATYYIQAIEALGGSLYPEEGLDDVFQEVLSRNPPEQFPEDLREWFQTTQAARELLDKALKLDECQFPVISDRPGAFSMYGLLLPYLAPMRHFARLKVVEGRLHESQGEFEQAAQSYLDILKISSHAGQDSTLIGGLVGIACNNMGTSALLRLLAVYPLDVDALAVVQSRLTPLLEIQPARGAWIPFERAAAKQIVQFALNNPQEFSRLFNEDWYAWPPGSATRLWRILVPDRTIRSDINRFFDRSEEFAKAPPWETMAYWAEGDFWTRMQESFHDWNFIAYMLLPALDAAESNFVYMQARGDALQIVIVLRRYQAERGRFPDALAALIPKYLESLPPDPFSGEPFHYRRENNDFILWSVGYDLDDDGGRDVGQNWREDGDLVWRSTWEVAE